MFKFTFEATNDPRKGIPYVAKLRWDHETRKIEREFYDLDRIWGKKRVTVSGEYEAESGDILEIRTGGSWKNDYRSWYVVTSDGREVVLADIDDTEAKAKVAQYLKGGMTLEELMETFSITKN